MDVRPVWALLCPASLFVHLSCRWMKSYARCQRTNSDQWYHCDNFQLRWSSHLSSNHERIESWMARICYLSWCVTTDHEILRWHIQPTLCLQVSQNSKVVLNIDKKNISSANVPCNFGIEVALVGHRVRLASDELLQQALKTSFSEVLWPFSYFDWLWRFIMSCQFGILTAQPFWSQLPPLLHQFNSMYPKAAMFSTRRLQHQGLCTTQSKRLQSLSLRSWWV